MRGGCKGSPYRVVVGWLERPMLNAGHLHWRSVVLMYMMDELRLFYTTMFFFLLTYAVVVCLLCIFLGRRASLLFFLLLPSEHFGDPFLDLSFCFLVCVTAVWTNVAPSLLPQIIDRGDIECPG